MASLGSLSRLSAVLTLDITQFMRNSAIVSTRLQTLRKNAVQFGQGFSRAVTFAFALVAGAALKTAASFDKIDAQLKAVTGGDGMDTLREQSAKLGRETIFTRTQVAGLQLELSKLGFQAQQTAGAVDASTRITTVFGGDLVKTGTTIAEVIRQFSNSGLTSKRVADVMAVAFKETALNTDNFAQAMKNVGSVANITGNDFESTVALLGLLANAGQKGGIAGTRLKGVMIRLGKELGVTGDELQLLTSGQLDFNQLIELFKNRAGVAAAVINEMGEEFYLLKEQLLDSQGAADAMASGLEDRLFYSIERVRAAMEAIGITIGQALTPVMKDIADVFQEVAKSIEEADKGTLKLILGLAALVAIAGPLVFILTQIGTAIAAIIANPVTAVVVASVLAYAAAWGAVLIAYSKTYGIINRVNSSLDSHIDKLGELTDKRVDELQKSLAVLDEEMEKVRNSDLGAEEKARQLDELSYEAEKLNVELASVFKNEDLGLVGALEQFRKTNRQSSKKLARALVNRDEIAKEIESGFRNVDYGRTGLRARGIEELQKLSEEQLSISLNINNLREEGRRAVDVFMENFRQLDLSIFTTVELETNVQALEEDINDLSRALDNLKVAEFDFAERVKQGFGKAFKGASWFEYLIPNFSRLWAASSASTVESVLKEIAETENEIALLKEIQAFYQEELNRRLQEQIDKAQEALELAKGFGITFKDSGSAAEAIDEFNELLKKLREVSGQFGATTGNVKSTETAIGKLQERAGFLKEVLAAGVFTTDLFKDVFGTRKNLDEQKTLIDGIVSALSDYTAGLYAQNQFLQAAPFQKSLDYYEKIQARLERILKLRAIEEQSEQARRLNTELAKLGVIDGIEYLQKQLARAKSELNGLINLNANVARQTELARMIEYYNILLKELEETVKKTKYQLVFGLLDPKVANGSVVERLNAQIGILDKKRQAVFTKLNEDFNKLADRTDLVIAFEQIDLETLLLDPAKLLRLIEENAGTELGAAFANLYTLIRNANTELTDLDDAFRTAQQSLDWEQNVQQPFDKSVESLEDLNTLGMYGLVTDADLAKRKLGELKKQFELAILNPDLLGYTALTKLKDDLNEIITFNNKLQREKEAIAFFQQQLAFIGDAFIAAAQNGEDFFETLRAGFLNTFYALIGKLITLIALFAVLAVFTGGTSMKFGQFIASGFGFDQLTPGVSLPGERSAQESVVTVEGAVSGSNLVIMNRRGSRSYDRTFG